MPKRKRRTNDLLDYAKTLAAGRALNVRRLAEFADYDAELLQESITMWNKEGGYVDAASYHDIDWPTWNGINIALTRALADSRDRTYRNRQHQGSR